MRPVLVGLAVVASLATSLIEVDAQYSCGGFLEMSCEEFETRVAEEHASDNQYEEQDEQESRIRRGEDAEAANGRANLSLAEEKAVAVYWRHAYVSRDADTGKRTGRLGTPEGRLIYGNYVCDPNYDDSLSGGCVPGDRDYDCAELRSWGIVSIPVTGEDWMLLDDNGDGWGCEHPDFMRIQSLRSAAQHPPVAVPTAEPDKQCDGVLGALGCLLGQ